MKFKKYLSLFLITSATIMFEILLTRIFSVTMWYHYAFVAISVAMFGMTEGAILIQIFPKFFSADKTELHLYLSALLFSVTTILCYLIYLSIPFISTNYSFIGFFSIGLIFFVISIPFIFSGINVSLFLTRYPDFVRKLYAADLIGAAVGCIALILILNFADASSSVLIISLLPAISSLALTSTIKSKKMLIISTVLCIFIISVALTNIYLFEQNRPLINITWVKGNLEKKPIYEKWNSFSRIKVDGDSTFFDKPFGWGLSDKLPDSIKIRQLKLDIDANAATFLTKFSGSIDSVSFLRYDITNMAHYLRPNSDVFIIGSGGGRDVLSSLVFKQKSTLAIELNKDILKTSNILFGDFTGHLDRIPNVKFVDDEARSYLSRQIKKYDIIQLSLIDTWAATAAGGFVLSENSLYTIEAFSTFINHLKDNGVLSISRWYFRDKSTEMYRLVSLAYKSLTKLGINNPAKHLIILRNMQKPDHPEDIPDGIGTMLLSRKPFSSEDINLMTYYANELNFEVVLSPSFSSDTVFDAILNDYQAIVDNYPLNISAPEDDSPFFFHSLKLENIFSSQNWKRNEMTINMKAIYVMASLTIVVFLMTIFFIFIPLLTIKNGFNLLKKNKEFVAYFALIGMGFMFIEISQMQRLIIFLGHPVYSLSVVLFSLLLSSGAGSYFSSYYSNSKKQILITFVLLIVSLLIFGFLTPIIIEANQSSMMGFRIFISVLLLMPAGFLMGTAFPNGMKLANIKNSNITPWFWGINGATSICASVVSVIIALAYGISVTYWIGLICYVVVAMILVILFKKYLI